MNVPAGDDAGALAARLVARDVPVLAWLPRGSTRRRGWPTSSIARGSGACSARCPVKAPAARSAITGRTARAPSTSAGWRPSWPRERVLLVDVRDAWESCQGRVPGSVHLPLPSLREAAHLLPAVPTVTACTDGRRAAAAASALRRFGHRNVWRLSGAGVPDLLARPLGLDLLGAA